MRLSRDARRAVLLTLCLLSACAAADPTASPAPAPQNYGEAGDYLAGRFELSQGDFAQAAGDLLKASADNPSDQDLLLQAFIACVNAGRPEAVPSPPACPDNQVAQMVLANAAANAGDWDKAVELFRAMPRDGVMQLLQPLLLAWASQGAGDVDQALSTLRPLSGEPALSADRRAARRHDRRHRRAAGRGRGILSSGRGRDGRREPAHGSDPRQLVREIRATGARRKASSGGWRNRCRMRRSPCRA